jgi:ribonuclease VapC
MRSKSEARRISLGDRACLATAHILGIPAMTADRNWRDLDLPVEIEFIR